MDHNGTMLRSLNQHYSTGGNTTTTATDESGSNSDVDSASNNSSSCSPFSDFEKEAGQEEQVKILEHENVITVVVTSCLDPQKWT